MIYLVSIGPIRRSHREMLFKRRIMVIDLSDVFPADSPDREARTLEWFLINLEAGKPPDPRDWPNMTPRCPTPIPSFIASANYKIYNVNHGEIDG
jgi:hypothetical protein